MLVSTSIRRCSSAVLVAFGLVFPAPDALAQTAPADETRTARYFESVRERTPLLTAFLREMPKGADLHSHLSGAVYAEHYIAWAAADGLCLDTAGMALVRPPCDAGAGRPPVSDAARNLGTYGRMIDAWSMRNWHPARRNGHDQFFDTFGKFGAAGDRRVADMIAEVARTAARGRVSYLELMMTPDGSAARDLGASVGWNPDHDRMRDTLLKAGLGNVVARARVSLDSVMRRQKELLGCGAAQPEPACAVPVRWLYQVSRARPKEQVFAQILAGFEMAAADTLVVGLNLVQPEDYPLAMGDYAEHMRIIRSLGRHYPGVKVSLHAGELAPGLVPPEGLRFHIRQAVEVAGASRIGHGVDVMHEEDAAGLMREMARRGVMVEIALTSNDVILGIRGPDHPLHAYMDAGVPVALATDDEGVARSEMTMEYLKAAREQDLTYPQLKAMARTSLQHAFIAGESLWADPRAFQPVPACADLAAQRCRDLATRSRKAALQRDLELAFRAFEARYAAMQPAR